MGDEFDASKYGTVLALGYGVSNAVTNQTNTDIPCADASGNTLYVIPKSGSVIGISVKASGNVTSGSATFRAHKAGTEFPQSGYPAPVLSTSNSSASYATIRPGVLTFGAGDALGVSYSSTTDMEPTNSNDFAVLLFVQLDPN